MIYNYLRIIKHNNMLIIEYKINRNLIKLYKRIIL